MFRVIVFLVWHKSLFLGENFMRWGFLRLISCSFRMLWKHLETKTSGYMLCVCAYVLYYMGYNISICKRTVHMCYILTFSFALSYIIKIAYLKRNLSTSLRRSIRLNRDSKIGFRTETYDSCTADEMSKYFSTGKLWKYK